MLEISMGGGGLKSPQIYISMMLLNYLEDG